MSIEDDVFDGNPDTLEDLPTDDLCAELQSRFAREIDRVRRDCLRKDLPNSLRELLREVFDIIV